jgi:hypothetical protein
MEEKDLKEMVTEIHKALVGDYYIEDLERSVNKMWKY